MKPFTLFNTLGREPQELKPISPPNVGLYTCGPTVYQYAHIGNLRTYIFEDLLKRSLTAAGFKVRHVMNITDVGHLTSDADTGEDKMEKSAKSMGKSAWELAEFFTKAFFEDFRKLNCLRPDDITKATDYIPQMIELVRRLEKKGFTYRTSDGIYFDTSKPTSPDRYGALIGLQHLEGLKAGARVEASPEKKNTTDFALWKLSPKDSKRQMEWDSPWGRGFPGWHLECSAMSMDKLGETFDLHCGGVDHIPVHHTNEIAQSEGATGKRFVNMWVHGEFLVLGGKAKMAKSADNFLTLDRLIEEGRSRPQKAPYDPLAYRYLCLNAHYRTQLEFGWQAMDGMQKSLLALRMKHWRLSRASGGRQAVDDSLWEGFMERVRNDLNIPGALGHLWVAIDNENIPPAKRLGLLNRADTILAVDVDAETKKKLPPELMDLIDRRDAARKASDYKSADSIRQQIVSMGFYVEDTPHGSVPIPKP